MANWWNPPPMYKGRNVFIIGGGPSLKHFDFSQLEAHHAIGCNSAFRLGRGVCDICVFGDLGFLKKFSKELRAYGGPVVTVHPDIATSPDYPWIHKMKRETKGLHHAPGLGWNGNTGALAINLALIMGAARVLLLGFDMELGPGGEPNWHDHIIDITRKEVYHRFKLGYEDVAADWKSKFSDREIINLNPESTLEVFPKMEPEYFLGANYDVRRRTA